MNTCTFRSNSFKVPLYHSSIQYVAHTTDIQPITVPYAMTRDGNQLTFPSIFQQQVGLIISFNLAFCRKLNVIFFLPIFCIREIRSAVALACTPFNAVIHSQRGFKIKNENRAIKITQNENNQTRKQTENT